MVRPDRAREQTIESPKTAWLTQIDRKKAFWDAQVRGDKERQNRPDAQNAETREQVQTNDTGDARNPSSELLQQQSASVTRLEYLNKELLADFKKAKDLSAQNHVTQVSTFTTQPAVAPR